MHIIERVFLISVIGVIFPLIGFLGGWWGTFQFYSDLGIFACALGGAMIGVIVDVVFLKRWLVAAWNSDLFIWMGIYLFYTVCLFGFFMGVPVFNLVLAIPAGYYVARRASIQEMDELTEKEFFLSTKIFTTVVIALICLTSAFLALRDPTTAENLELMLRLSFKVTQPMIIGLIVVGGAGILVINWWLTGMTIQLTSRMRFHEPT
jgi:hypothetical protein